MKLAIMQPYFFPYIGYFQCIKAVDKYIIYDDLNYIYQGWVDRNRLVDKSGKIFYIRPQVSNASVSKLISEIELQPKQYWREKMVKTLLFSYANAAYFDEVMPLLKDLLAFETKYLSDFNYNTIVKICDFLDVRTEVVKENQKYAQLEETLRNNENFENFFPEIDKSDLEVKVIRAIKICKTEKADIFINAFGGQELYAKDNFKNYDIEVKFIKTNDIEYKQFSNTFFPHLSIIDVLMHNGKEGTKELLNQYELI